MGLFTKKAPEAPDLPQPAEPPPEPKPAALRTFAERQADYTSVEAEIAREHEATLAELTRGRKAADERRGEREFELEERKTDDLRAARVVVHSRAHEELASVLLRLFGQISNRDVIALVETLKRANAHALELLGDELSAQRFALIAVDAFRPISPGILSAALAESFWRYVGGSDVLFAATDLRNAATQGNLPLARAAFEKLELALFSLSKREPTPEELERWQAKIDPDPTIGERFEAALEAKRKADEQEAMARHNGAWAKHQADRRKGSREPWVPPTPLETSSDVFIP